MSINRQSPEEVVEDSQNEIYTEYMVGDEEGESQYVLTKGTNNQFKLESTLSEKDFDIESC